MALVDVKDKSVHYSVPTGFHTYQFGPSEKPKILDLFEIQDRFSKEGTPTIKHIYGTTVWKMINGVRVHKGFYVALKDFIRKYDLCLVKLTREEEDFYKSADPEIYEIYKTHHKGQKFYHELLEERKNKAELKK